MRWSLVLLALVSAVVGAAIALLLAPQPLSSNQSSLACRPSAPEMVPRNTDAIVLYFGNSLVFDHDWTIDGTQPVNCGQQGLTALKFLSLPMPNIVPDVVVLGFGTVEMARAASNGETADAKEFSESMESTLERVLDAYPSSSLMILLPPALGDPFASSDHEPFQDQLRRIAREQEASVASSPGSTTYDGVHLNTESYAPWREQIADLVSSLDGN